MLPTNYANLLQGNSLRVVSNPHQTLNAPQPQAVPQPSLQVQRPGIGVLQAAPSAVRPVASPQRSGWATNLQNPAQDFRVQPQPAFDQQQPQVGVTAWNLQHLAAPISSYPAFNTSIHGVPMHVPAYSGSGWTPLPLAIPLPQVSMPTLQKLNYIY